MVKTRTFEETDESIVFFILSNHSSFFENENIEENFKKLSPFFIF